MPQRPSSFFKPAPPESPPPAGAADADEQSLQPQTTGAASLEASAHAMDRKLSHRKQSLHKQRDAMADEANAIRAEFHQRHDELAKLKAALVVATQRLDDRTVELAKMQESIETQLSQHAGYAELLHRKVKAATQDTDALAANARQAAQQFTEQIEAVCARSSDRLNMQVLEANALSETFEQHVIPDLREQAQQIKNSAVSEARDQLLAELHDASAKLIASTREQIAAEADACVETIDEQINAADRNRQALQQRLDHDLAELVQRVSNTVAQRVDQQIDHAVTELYEQAQQMNSSTTLQMNGARRALGELVASARKQLHCDMRKLHEAARQRMSEAEQAAAKIESAVDDASTREQELSKAWDATLVQIEQRSDEAMKALEDQLQQRFDRAVDSLVNKHTAQVGKTVQQEAEELEVQVAKRLRTLKDEVDNAVRYAVYRVTGNQPDAPTPAGQSPRAGDAPSPAEPRLATPSPTSSPSPIDEQAQQDRDRKANQRFAA